MPQGLKPHLFLRLKGTASQAAEKVAQAICTVAEDAVFQAQNSFSA